MLLSLFVILMLMWLLGMISSYTLGGFIHLLLLVALVVVLIRIIEGRSVWAAPITAGGSPIMNQLRTSGLALIVLGIVTFGYEGVLSYRTRTKVLEAGSIQVTTQKTHTIQLPPTLGSLAFIGGVTLLLLSVKKPA